MGHAWTAVFYPAGRGAALRQVAAGGPGDHLRDRLDTGLDINDPQESHVLQAQLGRTFSALQLISIMYAGFKRIEPGMDIGVELGEEWGMAERLRKGILRFRTCLAPYQSFPNLPQNVFRPEKLNNMNAILIH